MKDRLLIPPDILAFHLFLDTQGQDPGIGPSPNRDYWEAVGRFNSP